MNEEELKRLIQKYYNGESSEEEEELLRIYFRRHDIPRGYEAEKVIFGYYDVSLSVPEPSHDFEAQILAAIDATERKGGIRKLILPALSAAAGILILSGAYIFFSGKSETKDTFTDPQLAYVETVRILHDVSTQLNHGVQELKRVGKLNEIRQKSFNPIKESNRIVEKNLQTLQNSVRVENFQRVEHFQPQQ